LPLLKRFSGSEEKGKGHNDTKCTWQKLNILMVQHWGSLVKVDLQLYKHYVAKQLDRLVVDLQLYKHYVAKQLDRLANIGSMFADLRTEDSGKLGCRLIGPERERFETLQDFAVTGRITFVLTVHGILVAG